ncbi:GNAT family protein [Deinococcus ficus]|uniref:GNAT family protein n=1 Tax=Deinococcus ficus TaxID=317577 RepID=UPI003084495F
MYDPQLWSGGHGTRALRLWTAATFAGTDAHVLTPTTWSGNARMFRAARRCGYCECARTPEAAARQRETGRAAP